MIFEQYYLECLSQASYLVGDEVTGRAVVVDPRRDIDEYVADAARSGVTIELIVETHVHADFLSGHLELSAATGAPIGFGAAAEVDFDIRRLHDGDTIDLGGVRLVVLETPGHTPESISLLVYESGGEEPWAVLTGDTLFIGDVGRPDLLSSVGVTAEDLGGRLYDSIHEKLLTLPDVTRVFPGHGAGSACGKNLSTETQSTIGDQRRTNYALAPMSRAEFVAVVTEGQPDAPAYFAHDARLNRLDRALLDESEPSRPLDVDEVLSLQAAGAAVVDARDAASFAAGHLRGSINVGLGGRFAEYLGSVVDPGDEVVLVAEPGTETEARVRMARIGFDRAVGHLAGGIAALVHRPDVVAVSSRLTAQQLERSLEVDEPGIQLVDVRGPGEFALGTVGDATSVPLPSLRERLHELDVSRPVVVHCAGGYRSMIAASLLEAEGFADVSDLLGGYQAWTGR